MRSLVTQLVRSIALSRDTASDGAIDGAMCVDSERRIVYWTVVDAGGVVELLSTRPDSDAIPIFGDSPMSVPVAAHFNADSATVCVALTGGEIVSVSVESGMQEIVGSIDDGILAMAWAPDAELGVFVSAAGTILVMTQAWDLVGETSLFDKAGHTREQFVSVGWGKKETQFHGSAGKAAAQEKPQDANNSLTPDDDLKPRVSWRGDGKYFAVSFVDPKTTRRVIRTYTREAAHHSTSEPIPSLQKSIAWRPLGNLIATAQTLPSKQLQIAFFETNGLRHGEFFLRETAADAEILELAWNCDSSVLAVMMKRKATGRVSVQMWTMGNYYYYLKQEVYAPLDGDNVDVMLWDPEEALTLHFLSGKGRCFQTRSFTSMIQTAPSNATESQQPVLVTDGKYILVTPFRTSNMPPPMCEYKLGPFDACVSSVSVGEKDSLAVLLADGSIVLTTIQPNSLLRKLSTAKPSGVSYRQIAFASPNTIMVVASFLDTAKADAVMYFDFVPSESGQEFLLLGEGEVSVPGAEVGIMRLQTDSKNSIVETAEGLVSQLQLSGGSWSAQILTELPAPCPWIAAVEVGKDYDSLETVVIGLSDRNRFYINSRLVSSEVTSFFVHDDHIIVTTLSHTARFIPLSVENEDALVIPPTGSMVHDETLRRVERGSKIVTAVPGDMKLVLQMPRGNLETIYPRALVLSSIRSSLDKLDYKTAFTLCRKHRINMNLLVDHDPASFMTNVSLFVELVKDADFLNLFVSSLSETDVTKTMYVPVPAPPPKPAHFSAGTKKVTAICTAMREALIPLDTVTYITTVLTTFAKPQPQELEAAMSTVKKMKSISLEETENALKYLIFLADANRLYDVALGMYDFQLVVMVAQFSQKDPREYLPFLTALKALTKNRQYYRIDDHLGRHSSALGHLCALIAELEASGDAEKMKQAEAVFTDELLPYVAKHNLFKDALVRYETNDVKLRALLDAHGSYLFSKAKFAEAGLMFYMANNKTRALLAYRSEYPLWRQALSVAQEIQVSASEMADLAHELSETLMEKHEYQDASVVYIEYVNDILGGVRALLKGGFWDEAVRIAHKQSRGDLVASEIKPAVHAEYETAVDDVKEMLITFQKQRARLDIVRKEYLEKQAKIDSGEYDPLLDTIDMMSDTTSMASSKRTARTGKTSISSGNTAKSRRRQDRKRATGKEGTFYEEEFLVNSLFKAVEKSNALRGSIHRLVTALMYHGYISEARNLQSTYESTLPLLKAGCVGVFEKENIVNKGSNGVTVEEEKIAQMVRMGTLSATAIPGGVAPPPLRSANDVEVERKRDPKYPAAPPVFSADEFGLDVL
ncbi:hypothetical protein HDU78_001127 [Chytriomyces hyalinus]|nr:hypothetical protein HDU78_001127 [Chytriomyces hyalinus]